MTRTNVFSYVTIVVSMALMSGLALGHVTKKSIHPRLSANLPSDPVERFGLGQNAYQTTNAKINTARRQSPAYAAANYDIGRYVDGARVLVPSEPARKIDRIRLERLQAWNDENFGSAANLDNDDFGYAEEDLGDYQPIDVGAVEAASDLAANHAVLNVPVDVSAHDASNIALGGRTDEESGGNTAWDYAEN